MRLDNYLVENSLSESRTKAQGIIKDGLVSVNGNIITKSSLKIDESDEVNVAEHKEYVSRSAHKLSLFLEELNLDVTGNIALDIGSSTGGFTQVLLENMVKEVSAVDVGRDQLHKSLLNDERVFSHESCDIREFKSDKVFDIVVSDVSFISLLNILDDVDRLASDKIILLFKPQFEVGREAKRDNHGVVLDEKAIMNAMIKFEDAAMLKGWELIMKSPSKLTGKEGNLEYCYYYEK
ncbi:RNA binding methyltransferase, FtsJ-like protein [Sulfurimonas gotlandica GD1]|uniref:RNA binding methyltransferase, FtsJ-like protein n=1 Tax=Sulfurimonas gotlandica (strain DSM 19862 / JCM 16533 / GD1) TaxID=929558 RepID=B6BMP5_SULGG|nr:TlyA family RNA methyltransferase [Sulfurimonas gotlandica]EDZ61467.1 ribosomal RNA large subunit methyltransferase J [Sulfurimonas gotlandica GD1]EHP30838.1 RNA binding methyltransferase, FtsJ-like protein [Sulfurimonas gotlandica GD1]